MNHDLSRQPSSVLVLGASGRFGGAAMHAFADAGWQVLAQSRGEIADLPAGARHLRMGLDDLRLAAQADGVSVVIHAVNPRYDRWEVEALPLARAGFALARVLGARFMLPGNVYNFGQAMPAVLREDTPQRADTRKGRLRVRMEDELAECARQGLDAVVVRAGDFYGAGSGSWLDLSIVRSLGQGKLVYPGPLDREHAWAYLPDLARAFVALAGGPRVPGLRRLHFSGHTLTGEQLLTQLQAAATDLGLAPARGFSRGGMPWPLIRAGGLVVPMWREIAEMAYLWQVPHRLDGRALREAVGPLPDTPVAQALRESLIALGLAAPALA